MAATGPNNWNLTPLSHFFPKWKPSRPIIIVSRLNDIQSNLALEHVLASRSNSQIHSAQAHQTDVPVPTLFLWRNKSCVIIGRNQNPMSECRLDLLENDGVKLARRNSGGGAVYQDLGNSVYTFIMPRLNMTRAFGNAILLDVFRNQFKVNAEASGRNDLCVDGQKFSGAAFKLLGNKFIHHGCIIRDSDLTRIGRYLAPHPLKLKETCKGTKSVVSRVTRLCDHTASTVEHDDVCEALKKSFLEKLNFESGEANFLEVSPGDPILSEDDYWQEWMHQTSQQWIVGTTPPYEFSCFAKLDFGILELRMKVVHGTIDDIQLFTDALDENRIHYLWHIFRKGLIGMSSQKLSSIPENKIIEWVLSTTADKCQSALTNQSENLS